MENMFVLGGLSGAYDKKPEIKLAVQSEWLACNNIFRNSIFHDIIHTSINLPVFLSNVYNAVNMPWRYFRVFRNFFVWFFRCLYFYTNKLWLWLMQGAGTLSSLVYATSTTQNYSWVLCVHLCEASLRSFRVCKADYMLKWVYFSKALNSTNIRQAESPTENKNIPDQIVGAWTEPSLSLQFAISVTVAGGCVTSVYWSIVKHCFERKLLLCHKTPDENILI